MIEFFWGYKTEAMFDVWTIEHFIVGISLGSGVWLINNRPWVKALQQIEEEGHPFDPLRNKYDIFCILAVAFGWESLEHYLEIGLLGDQVAYWFQGTEFWANRLITDPLMLVLGYFMAKNFRYLVIPARVFSLTWFLVHVLLFPHSMYLHELF